MDMMSVPPTPGAEHNKAAPSSIFLYHPTFCQLALPVRAAKGPWSRDVGTASVSIETGETTGSLPAGKMLRLLLIAMMDAAARSNETRVDMQANPAEFAESLGLQLTPAQLRGLAEQLDRIVSAKIVVGLDGTLPCSLLDGRSRPIADAAGWRPVLKLNTKFLARFLEKTIPLDRATVLSLWETPTALDAYAAITFVTCEMPPGEVAMTSWEDLLTRFSAKGQDLQTFRAQFETDLAAVNVLCPNLSLVSGDEGVEISTIAKPATPDVAPKPTVLEPTTPEPTTPEPAAPAAAAPVAPVLERPRPAPAPVPASIASAPAPTLFDAPPPPQAAQAPIPEQQPQPQPQPQPEAESQQAEPDQGERTQRRAGRVMALKSHLTGLQQVIWLQRSQGRDDPLVEVTPGGRYDPALVTVLALEPVVVQIAGGLYQRDFDRVSSWTMANRDLIDSFWFDEIDDMDAINARVKKVPSPGWRD